MTLGLWACRPSPSGPAPRFRGDFRELDRPVVGEALRDDWEALERLEQEDPRSPQIQVHADRLLRGGDAPLGVRLGAYLAKAKQSYAVGDDGAAVAAADEGLALLQPLRERTPDITIDLGLVRLRALVRGGDPSRAMEELEQPLLRERAGLHPSEWLGLEAIAYERGEQVVPAVLALARWRDAVPDGSASAAYAELRLQAMAPLAQKDALREAISEWPLSPARQCLERVTGGGQGELRAAWVERCGVAGGRLGLLLPRTGKLAALSDTQLAAVSVALPLLAPSLAESVTWRDSGSTPAQARVAAEALVAAGATVIVGPVGPANVKAVGQGLGHRARFIVPGEDTGGIGGVAPSVEARVEVLLQEARGRGASRFVVAAPDNSYGHRAVEAVRARLGSQTARGLIVQMYAPETTSFAPTIAPLLPAIARGAAVLLPDHISRVELLVRQLARAGKAPRPVTGDEGALVLSTAEGLSEAALGLGHEVLQGMLVAPVAVADGAAAEFAQAYQRQQGEPPSDQSLLMFFALRKALTGAPGEKARVMLIEGGRLVAPEQASKTP